MCFDYGVINHEWSQIDLYWKSGTDQKRDIHFHRYFEWNGCWCDGIRWGQMDFGGM